MPKDRRRKIEVPRETQPQLELGDTPEDTERRGEREEREKKEQEERDRERIERERGWKRARKGQKCDHRHRY